MSEKNTYLVKLVLGDPSNDGHGRKEDMKYVSNYSKEEIWNAYMESCKKTGLQFNHNENYTGLEDLEDWRQIFTEYGDCYLNSDAAAILKENGIDPANYGENSGYDDELYFESDGAADLIMAFIALSMPSDWTYTLVVNDYQRINGPHFGYGLYD